MSAPAKVFALWSCTAALCCAQEARPPALEEVLVTAQRREQKAQDVPMSLSVFTNDQLAQRQLDDIDALQYAAPNLVVSSNMTSRNAAAIAMRGQFERDASPTVDPPVGLYLDGVYIARSPGANLRMFDLERVEVLRGPQGTLFGRNTVGGAINVVPRQATGEFEGSLSARLGNYQLREFTGMLNVPLGDSGSALRLTAANSARDGYAESALTGRDIASDDTRYARVQARIAPQESWSLNLSFDYTRSRGGSQWMTLSAVLPPSLLVPPSQGNANDSLSNYVDPFARRLNVNRAGESEAITWGGAATLAIETDHANFKSISAWRQLEVEAHDSDQDGTPYDISAILGREDRQEQFSQEFQAYGQALESRLEWIGGLYWFGERARMSQQFPLLVLPSLEAVEQDFWGDVQNESLAAYTQITYAIRPELRFTAGVRFNRDTRQLTSRNMLTRRGVQVCRVEPVLRDAPDVCQATLPGRDFDYLPFTVGFEYEPSDTALWYLKASRGHRSGGFNFRGASAADFESFDPESVLSYELGSKASFFEQRLRVDFALFRSLFDDIQLTAVTAPQPGLPPSLATIRNGGEARIDGGELEISALLGPLEISAAAGVTDARYTDIDPGATDIRPGSNFLMTPRTTAAMALDWPVTWNSQRLRFHADYAWRDDISFWYAPNTLARQDSYGLLNARASVRFDRSDIEFALWGRNLTDTRYFQRAFQNVFLVAAIPGDPRTFGVSFAYSFD